MREPSRGRSLVWSRYQHLPFNNVSKRGERRKGGAYHTSGRFANSNRSTRYAAIWRYIGWRYYWVLKACLCCTVRFWGVYGHGRGIGVIPDRGRDWRWNSADLRGEVSIADTCRDSMVIRIHQSLLTLLRRMTRSLTFVLSDSTLEVPYLSAWERCSLATGAQREEKGVIGTTHDTEYILRLSIAPNTQFRCRLTQYWHGHCPSHLTFFRRHTSQAWLVRDPPSAAGGRARRFPRVRSGAAPLFCTVSAVWLMAVSIL